MGVISAIGNDCGECLESLSAGRTGIAPVSYLTTSHPEFPVGEVKMSNAGMKAKLGICDDALVSRTSLLEMIALKEALDKAGLSGDDVSRAALISGTTVAGMDTSEKLYLEILSGGDRHSDIVGIHDCGASTDSAADLFGGFSFSSTISTACSSAANAMMLGANLIRSGRTEIAVAGGGESLSDYHLNGFNSLMILDSQQCRPFDATRAGLNLGEGAAFLVLESEESMLKRGAKPLAELAGFGNACDAFHQTASSDDGEGAYLAMTKAIRMAGAEPSQVDYINAHGTGTPNNDPSESAAIRRVFGKTCPPVSSTKSFTGHTTSASGSIESVFCILAMRSGFIPVNLGFSTSDEACITPFTGDGSGRKLSLVMCNSFGFGGNDSSILFRAACK